MFIIYSVVRIVSARNENVVDKGGLPRLAAKKVNYLKLVFQEDSVTNSTKMQPLESDAHLDRQYTIEWS